MVFPLKGWPQDAFRLHLANEAGLFVMYRCTDHKSRTASAKLDDGSVSFGCYRAAKLMTASTQSADLI
jgi:hypothetical protein